MKKFVFLLFSVLMIAGLGACSSDDDHSSADNENKITKKWKVVKFEEYTNGELTDSYEGIKEGCDDWDMINFDEDGTWQSKLYYFDGVCHLNQISGIWELDGNNLTLMPDGEDIEEIYIIQKLTKTEFNVDVNHPNEPEKVHKVFMKVY